ncbi:MAG: TolC family protein [Aquabacterium sp.]|uniref:TolC family protein n=1 Tax=Aquabacterium sp. TaxID=1872578 RepID=UPI002715CC89|nr:TolC family protein [Aquabacterium sp.]MDO9001839.1 TolC family protein [Aquabacterium sp.]
MRRFDLSWAARAALCVPFFFQAAWAQSLSLDVALSTALAQHPDLRATVLEREAAEGATQQAGAWLNPELSTLVEDNQRATRTTTIQLNQPFELGGKRSARISAARAAQGQADLDVLSRRAQVRSQVMAAFHGAAVAQERVRLSDELGSLSTQAREAASKRVVAGKVSPVEELKAQVAEAQALSASTVAQSDWRGAVSQLRLALGDPSVKFDRVEADLQRLPSVGAWEPLAQRLEASPAIARAQQEITRRQALSDLERARRMPDLTVSLGAKRDEQLGRDQPILGVSLVLPLFDRNQGAILEANRREDKARVELEAVRASVEAQATQALAQLSSALTQAQTLREKVLPAARQAFAASTKGYELGKFGFLDVLDAQRTLFEAETLALSATAQAYQADARLLELLGEPNLTKD